MSDEDASEPPSARTAPAGGGGSGADGDDDAPTRRPPPPPPPPPPPAPPRDRPPSSPAPPAPAPTTVAATVRADGGDGDGDGGGGGAADVDGADGEASGGGESSGEADDEEEGFLLAIEREEEEAAASRGPPDQPRDAAAAPRLLRAALERGQVKVDDSEEEEEEEEEVKEEEERKRRRAAAAKVAAEGKVKADGAATATATATATAGGGAVPASGGGGGGGGGGEDDAGGGVVVEEEEEEEEEEKKGDDDDASEPPPPGDHHVHARANQLDFLLSKASEYSTFISQDLEDLQRSMQKKAERALAKAERRGRKRKSKGGGGSDGGGGGGGSRKKSKRGDGSSSSGEAALRTAQDKHRSGGGAIFIQPENLADGCRLKDYQLEGVRWLTSLFENGVSGILADEMGLGKTIQVIAMIAHMLTMEVSGPFMVVAPLATLPNWVREFQKWLPTLPVVRYHGTRQERDAMLSGPLHHRERKSESFPVIVTSYEVAIKDQKKLIRLGEFTYLVVDEGQRLKNHRCTLIQSLKRIPAANRLLLSGTPIQNNLDELWSLLNFVNPAIFDDLSVFQSWFGFRDIGQKSKGGTDEEAILLEQRKNKTVTKLHEILRPFLLRRIKRDVLTDLPPKKEVVVYAGMSKLQQGYADLIDRGELRDVLMGQGIDQARSLSQTNKQMNHRKNCNHPFMFGEPIDPQSGIHLGTSHPHLLVRASGKFDLLDRMLDRLHRDGHQVLIFSQMTALLNVIEDYLLYRHWRYCRIDGSTKIDDRQRQMDVFNSERTGGIDGGRNIADDRHFVFLLSTRAGGLGINLATADTCVIFDSDWNPHQDSQAMDRCHRIGQTRPVAVYRLLTVNSVDIEMMEKQISKKKLERMAIVGGDFRRAGSRSRGEFSSRALDALLRDDIEGLQSKGGDSDVLRIQDDEFDAIMDRGRLFAEGDGAVPSEGRMYDILESKEGDVLGAMNA